MRMIPSVVLLALAGAMISGCGAANGPISAAGLEGADAPVALAHGSSLPPGHPPLYSVAPTLPEGHPPVLEEGAGLPQGHPRCPRSAQSPQAAPSLDFRSRPGAEELVST
jgi:hypothetical protein